MILKVSKTKKVKGQVVISGSKNSALALICAALLTKKDVTITNIPLITDVKKLLNIITDLGVDIRVGDKQVTINAKKIKNRIISDEVKEIRGSSYLLGSLLARTGKVEMPVPGGCNLGERPLDYHLMAFQKMGFKNVVDGETIKIKKEKIKDAEITFPKKSVGATINTIILAASLKTKTIINNPSLEPEVQDVIKMLKNMGANIDITENQVIINPPIESLKGCIHQVIPDRIEAGSYLLLAAALPKSEITLQEVNPKDLTTVLILLKSLGNKIKIDDTSITINSPNVLNKANLIIGPYPFFPTDLQQLLSVALLNAKGVSYLKDTVFENRVSQIKELEKMKGDLKNIDGEIIITPSKLKGSIVKSHDLRCAMALVIAGGMAEGITLIENGEMLLRGYERPIEKLKKIGFIIEKLDKENEY